jgi:hypothetical protein
MASRRIRIRIRIRRYPRMSINQKLGHGRPEHGFGGEIDGEDRAGEGGIQLRRLLGEAGLLDKDARRMG